MNHDEFEQRMAKSRRLLVLAGIFTAFAAVITIVNIVLVLG